MDADLKKQWLEELRGDCWQQCTGRLARYDEDGELCLCQAGVLAYAVLGYPLVKKKLSGLGFQFIYNKRTKSRPIFSIGLVPREITDFIGLQRHIFVEAVGMNDKGVPLDEIADYLEEHA